ncbi:gp53-like domain-containing protein [Edwardsiella tarda]
MYSFNSDLRPVGIQYLPGGYVRQWGVGVGNSSGDATITFPVAFSETPFSIAFGYRQAATPDGLQSAVINDPSLTNTGFSCRVYRLDGSGQISGSTSAFFWNAEGKI